MARRRPLLVSLLLLFCGVVVADAARAATETGWEDRVLKIDVVRSDGKKESGSGVLVDPNRLLTNCHVLRGAQQIRVSRGSESWVATADVGDTYRDLCLLRLPRNSGKPAAIAEPGSTRVGQRVYAVGYPGGTLTATHGTIKGLFTCACDGGKVIQTSAGFEPGASGGGLFNENGELVGILTFKSHSGGIFHFAIPITWLKQLRTLPASPLPDQAPFWEHPSRSSGYFLVACDLSAKKKWHALAQLCLEWVREDPLNPQAWMASGQANLGLKRRRAASEDFRKVLELDPTHAEALVELQQLELDGPLPAD